MGNDFHFVLEGNAKGQEINFQWNGQYRITPDEQWHGVSVDPGTDKVTISIDATRTKSDGPANWYKDFVKGNASHMIHTEGGSAAPKELNFAIQGTLTIGQHSYEVCLGQGHGTRNNWHLCSESIDADENHRNGFLTGPAVHGQPTHQYSLTQSGSHEFKVESVGEPADRRTYNNITEPIWSCIKNTSIKENGTKYSGENQGTATTKSPVGLVILGYDFNASAGTLTYTIQQKPKIVTAGQIWNGVQDAITDCRR